MTDRFSPTDPTGIETVLRARTRRIGSWGELQEVLLEDAWNPRMLRHRSHHLFRGHSRADVPLSSGLSRHDGRQVVLEKHLLRNFKKYARSHLEPNEHEPSNFWHWIALAQHHGLPTRLLDWTYSPLIAAHFACWDFQEFDRDGAIWMVDSHRAHDLLSDNLRGLLRAQGAHVFTDEMLSEEIASFEELSAPQRNTAGQVLFFEPPSLSARIVNQYACFSVQIGEAGSLDTWLCDNPNIWQKVVIPAELKWEIRDKLDQSNITERVLFPGLDGLCAWLSRQYYPRPPQE